jgi:hypothetical protein
VTSQQSNQQWREKQGPPKADQDGDAVSHIGAQHVKTGVRKIEHAHHAEDQCEPGAQHEQQQAIAHAIEQRDREELDKAGRQAQ